MASVKTSLSFTPELASALRGLARERGEDLSRTVETFLRENAVVGRAIARLRAPAGTKKGRSVEELLVLGRVARAAWRRKLRTGAVRVRGWK